MTIVFFDIGETLAAPRLSEAHQIVSLEVYPYIPRVLAQLAAAGARLGVITDHGNVCAPGMQQLLETAGIYRFLDEALLVYHAEVSLTKASSGVFTLAAHRASAEPPDCVFVAESARKRALAVRAGMRVAPHPLLVASILAGDTLHYARITVPRGGVLDRWPAELSARAVVPIHVCGSVGTAILAVAPAGELAVLDDLGFYVDRLGGANVPLVTDAYLLRDDEQRASGFLVNRGGSAEHFSSSSGRQLVLASTNDGLYVALPAERSIDEFHFRGALHGPTQRLLLDPSLVHPQSTLASVRALTPMLLSGPDLTEVDVSVLRALTPGVMRRHIERYTGRSSLDNGGVRIASRHLRRADNRLATQQLARDLAALGNGYFKVQLHRFTHEDTALFNIEAEIEGASSSETVLVTAHLDSPDRASDSDAVARDGALGADDDASGIAGVLAIAEIFFKLSAIRRFARRVRFVLFNAQEEGLRGSQAYARDVAAAGTGVAAAFQLDMIGSRHRSDARTRSFEVHVGFSASPEVEARSLALAERIARVFKRVSPGLDVPQIYRSVDPDPAAGRSDHTSFQERGYAACVVSAGFRAASTAAGVQADPADDDATDELVYFEYAADVARAVAAAALVTAL